MKTKASAHKENRKLSTILKVVIALFLIMIACFVVGGILIAISVPTILEQKYIKEFQVNETQTFDGVNNLEINTVSSDITFLKSQNNELKVVFHGFVNGNENMKTPELITKQKGDTLEIEVKYPNNPFNFGTISEETSLDIYLPEEFNGDINADTVSGNLRIEEKTLKSFELNSVSGSVDAKDLQTDSFKISTISGDSFISGVIGKTAIESVSGDLNMKEEKINDDLKIDTISGDVAIAFFEDQSIKLEYTTISGNFQNTLLEDIISDIEPGEKRYTGTKNSGAYDVIVTTVSGSLDIS